MSEPEPAVMDDIATVLAFLAVIVISTIIGWFFGWPVGMMVFGAIMLCAFVWMLIP
jgi:hypothetical protein